MLPSRLPVHAGRCFLLFALMLVLSAFSLDSRAGSCTPTGRQDETIVLPSTVTVPRDLAVGEPLTPWFYSSSEASRTCTSGPAIGYVAVANTYDLVGLSQAGSMTTKSSDGVAIPVYETGLAGVGIAIASRGWFCASFGSFDNLRGGYCGRSSASASAPATYTGQIRGQIQVRLIKTGPISAGKVDLSSPVRQNSYVDGTNNFGGDDNRRYYDISAFDVALASCVTPDVTVDLGNHTLAELPDAGSTTTGVRFSVKLDCPKELNGVRYSFKAAAARSDVQGLINLSADSSANNIAVKLMDVDGNPLDVANASKYTLASYATGTGGKLELSLMASYYRLPGTYLPHAGTANAEVEFTFYYE